MIFGVFNELENVLFLGFQLLVVMERILSFPVTSPVMKVLTGLEVLLRKAQVRLSAHCIAVLWLKLRQSFIVIVLGVGPFCDLQTCLKIKDDR